MPGPRVRCQLPIGNSRSLFARPTLFLAGHKFLMCYLGREVCKKKKATLAYTQFLMLYLMSKPLKQILQHVLGVQHYIGYKHRKNCECSPGVTLNCQVTMIVMNSGSQWTVSVLPQNEGFICETCSLMPTSSISVLAKYANAILKGACSIVWLCTWGSSSPVI